jgi:DNA recombination protein RmuC
MDLITLVIVALAGFVSGVSAAYFFNRKKSAESRSGYDALLQAKNLAEQRLDDARAAHETFKGEITVLREQNTKLTADTARLETMVGEFRQKLSEQKTLLEDFYKQNREQFENIAGRIIRDQSQQIQLQHSQKLNDILSPLKEKIEKFETTVQHTHQDNIRQNQSLKEQLKQLQDLNRNIGEEARNLATALKGQVKTQGNWGEMILESVLQRSGLVRDREYFVQASFNDQEGKRFQPDILVRLPDQKTIVIDSKVSLVAYEKYCSAETDADREAALKEHLQSIRKHIKGLGEKKYQQLYQINTLDFVLLFIPVEPAFSLAIQKDNTIYGDAFDSNIVLVTTSTLLATLRTIAGIWKLEYQNANALEIARQGGALYDKFVGMIVDFEKIGSSIDATHRAWDAAKRKLSEERGNLVRSAEKLRELGAKTSKKIPASMSSDEAEDNQIAGGQDQE